MIPEKPNYNSKPKRKMTKSYFEKRALYYLGRFSSSTENLRKVLNRILQKRVREDDFEPILGAALIEEVIQSCLKLGYVDDKSYTLNKYKGLLERGKSKNYITNWLKQRGISDQMIADLVKPTEAEQSLALQKLITKKTKSSKKFLEDRTKALAYLCRAGFSYDEAKKALSEYS